MPVPPPPLPVLPFALQYAGPTTPIIRMRSIANLYQIAIRQRTVNDCFLGCAVVTVLVIALRAMDVEMPFPTARLILYAATLSTAVVTFRLAVALHGIGLTTFVGIFLLVLVIGIIIFTNVSQLIPVGGLLLLLTMNRNASRALQRHGIRVGLLGAYREEIVEMATALRQIKT